MDAKLQALFDRAKFPYADRIIHLFRAGSYLYGGTGGDTDYAGIFIEPPEVAIGLKRYEHFVSSTAKEGERHTPDDMDVTLYSLRKWMLLLAQGNPNAIEFLFVPPTEGAWSVVRRQILDGKLHLHRGTLGGYLGYATAQFKRAFTGAPTGRHGQRPESIVEFGYDVKAAYHICRLLVQFDYLTHGGELPALPWPREWLSEGWAMREGKVGVGKAMGIIDYGLTNAEHHAKTCGWPHTNIDRLSEITATAYLGAWFEQDEI